MIAIIIIIIMINHQHLGMTVSLHFISWEVERDLDNGQGCIGPKKFGNHLLRQLPDNKLNVLNIRNQ